MEGPEGHLYCRKFTENTQIYTVWESTKREKKTKKDIKHKK